MKNRPQESLSRSWCDFDPLPIHYYGERPRMIPGFQSSFSAENLDPSTATNNIKRSLAPSRNFQFEVK